jgi:hypothetical protein
MFSQSMQEKFSDWKLSPGLSICGSVIVDISQSRNFIKEYMISFSQYIWHGIPKDHPRIAKRIAHFLCRCPSGSSLSDIPHLCWFLLTATWQTSPVRFANSKKGTLG